MERLCLLLFFSLLSSTVEAQGNGAIQFYRFGNTSHLFSSGILQVYFVDNWGNVCFDTEGWGTKEADVVCRQMGWSGASATDPNIRTVSSFGVDTLPTVLSDVQCVNNSLLVLLQCSYSINFQAFCSDNYDVSVSCYTTKLWDSLGYPGLLRLVGGSYITEGRVEVYCNTIWGTVCDDALSDIEADTMCRQLGYSESIRHDHLVLPGRPTQPIWLDDVLCGEEPRNCLSSCKQCPSTPRHNCVHGEDFTISCRYRDDSGGSNLDTCDGFGVSSEQEGPSKSLIIGVAVGGVALLLLLSVPIIICCCVACIKREPEKEVFQGGNEPVAAQEKAATPIMGTNSPEVIQMENSPRTYRKVQPKIENQYVSYQPTKYNSGYDHVQTSAYNPYYQNEETANGVLSVNDERQFVTTPPAYLGNPAPQYH